MQTAPVSLSAGHMATHTYPWVGAGPHSHGLHPQPLSLPHTTEVLPSGWKDFKPLVLTVLDDTQAPVCQDERLSWRLELHSRKAQFDRDIHAALCVKFCSDSQLFYAIKIL